MRYCLTGGVPLDLSPSDAKENKSLVRKKLDNPNFLWDHPDFKMLPKIKHLLEDCFSMTANLRPSISAVSAIVLDSFTELACNGDPKSLIPSISEAEQLERQSVKGKGINLIEAARRKQSTSSKLSGDEWRLLLQWSKFAEDPIYSFLVGAIAYWDLVVEGDIKEYPADTGESSFYNIEYYY